MNTTMTTARLRRGYHLIPGPEGAWLLGLPDGTFGRVRADPEDMARLAVFLRGEGDEVDPDLLAALEQRGLLEEEEEVPDLGVRGVAVRGEGRVADAVAGLLREAGVGEVRREPDGAPLADADVLVSCAGWLPDARWRSLDAGCAERRIPWHGCHAEGARWYLGPLVLPGRTASYEDARARRLAASRYPEELLAYWRYLDAGVGVPPVPWPGPGTVAALAGALASDVLAVLRGEAPAGAGFQVGFEPETWTWTRHPVLPVPRVLEEAP